MSFVAPLKFAREVQAEAKKVVWPEVKTVRTMALMVLVLVTFVAIYLLAVDALLSFGVNWIIER
jgi:preprotein translocase SecE subunit